MAENADNKNQAIWGAQQIYMNAARLYHGETGGPDIGPPPNAIKLLQSLVGKQPGSRGQHIQDFMTKYNCKIPTGSRLLPHTATVLQ